MHFCFYRFLDADGVVKTGVQESVVAAVTERQMTALLKFKLKKEPGTLDADTVSGLVDRVFDKFGKPDVGVMFMPCFWMATSELAARPASGKNVRLLTKAGIQLSSMARSERMMVETYLQRMGLECLWSGEAD